jgi:hypothetical protein
MAVSLQEYNWCEKNLLPYFAVGAFAKTFFIIINSTLGKISSNLACHSDSVFGLG